MLEPLRKIILCFLWLLVGVFFLFVFLPTPTHPASTITYGVTFTPSHARYLGLDWQALYRSMLDDLGVRNFRLSAPWDEIEPQGGAWNFTDLDWQLDEANRRGATVMLAIGRKLPRWPECRVPQWAATLATGDMEQAILTMLQETVLRYRGHPAVAAWQVENEPYFTFGHCVKLPKSFYDRELALVRSLDPSRPIIGTDSGELSSWISLAARVDRLGVSMYRITWNPIMGYFSYPLAPSFYSRKISLVRWWTGKPVMLSELQMEPWLPNQSVLTLPWSELEKSFPIKRFADNLAFAREAGFDTQYLWGVEWWAWAATKGHPEYWDAARRVFGGR